MRSAFRGLVLVIAGTTLFEPPPPTVGAYFNVISIKRSTAISARGGRGQTLPDGSFSMTNEAIIHIIADVAPEPVAEVVGYPEWVLTERYDIVGKPAPDFHPTPDQQTEMRRNLLIERFKIAGHVEEQEQDGFALVLARSDGQLGPQLTRSTLACEAPRTLTVAAALPSGPSDVRTQCGLMTTRGMIESGGIKLDHLAWSLKEPAGGYVTDRTALDGYYAVSLHYASERENAGPNNAPSFFTALQEQLGLKLVPEKTKVKVFVIDHIERPTPD